jgi:hypothetical protein
MECNIVCVCVCVCVCVRVCVRACVNEIAIISKYHYTIISVHFTVRETGNEEWVL